MTLCRGVRNIADSGQWRWVIISETVRRNIITKSSRLVLRENLLEFFKGRLAFSPHVLSLWRSPPYPLLATLFLTMLLVITWKSDLDWISKFGFDPCGRPCRYPCCTQIAFALNFLCFTVQRHDGYACFISVVYFFVTVTGNWEEFITPLLNVHKSSEC